MLKSLFRIFNRDETPWPNRAIDDGRMGSVLVRLEWAAGRRQALSLRVSGLREPAPIQPEAVALQRADAERLVEAMSRLGADDRLVIAYRWLLGLGEAEMAEALGIARGTVKSRLSRAMTKLRTELVPEEGAR